MSDPYLIPGTECLRNKLSIDDPAELKQLEARIVSIREVEIARSALPGEYNSEHLQAFHRHLFGLPREHFVRRLAFYYGELNARHPFREGNGRTQRAFLRQLAASAGWRLDWSELSKSANIEASRRSLIAADLTMLTGLLDRVVVKI